MADDAIKYAEKDVSYEIVIYKHYSQSVRKRTEEYQSSGYVYGEWYDTFERTKMQVFQQTVEELNFADVVKAINQL